MKKSAWYILTVLSLIEGLVCSQSFANSKCERYLLTRLDLNFQVTADTKDISTAIMQAAEDTVSALYSPILPQANSRKKVGRITEVDLMKEFIGQLTPVYELLFKKETNNQDTSAFTSSIKMVSKAAYWKSDAPAIYAERYSAIQKYFSTVLLAYGVLNAKTKSTSVRKVLDLGAGRGDTVYAIKKFFPDAEITAIDQSSVMLEDLKKEHPDVRAIEMDFEVSPLADDSNYYDEVVSACAAGQFLNPVDFHRLLTEVRRVLKPGGYFVMEFGEDNFTSAADESWDFEEFQNWIETKGFSVERRNVLKIRFRGHNYYVLLARKLANTTPATP